jgi:chorismate dehydratase
MHPIRLGAVGYLNARPLVYGLELKTSLFSLRFDVPSKCAALLHEGSIDVGMIPSIEYLRGSVYCLVPGIAIVSDGDVESVALFSRGAIQEVQSVAVDTSSRTSTALLQILCAEHFGIDPTLVPLPPDLSRMLRQCDAALLIGDPALFFDHHAAALVKTDLGQAWTRMTGLPFVWAFWAGRPGVMSAEAIDALTAARDGGIADSDRIAADYCESSRNVPLAQSYLRDNMRYTLESREEEGLRTYYTLAHKHGLVQSTRPLASY